ncbi:MAG: ATP-binding protein [Myxococcales bacterium]|nr:ATP-binding protein [Myxococcales bacterium]
MATCSTRRRRSLGAGTRRASSRCRARVIDGERAAVEVIDEGPGIPPEQHDKLFAPFYRGSAASRHKGGLGLGLYITSEIARRHGGTVRVSSTPGHGAAFTVELPLRPISVRMG